MESEQKGTIAITADSVRLPKREADTHKGDYGRVLIVGGSTGFTGAPILSARAASRAGAGLVFAGVPKAIYEIAAVKLDEEMPFPLPDKDGRISGNAASEVLRRAKISDVCLIGPGLGVSDDITELVVSISRIVNKPLVLDADGLNAIAGKIGFLSAAICPLVLTPHPGEFERLSGQPISHLKTQPERAKAAVDFAVRHNCILVLKGNRTIIALPNGGSFVNTTGGPAMAKGGSGDVLAGMIAALIAQRSQQKKQADGNDAPTFSIVDAVVASVYLHGLAGDMCAQALGEYSVTASDIIKMLPRAFMTVCN